MEEIDRFGNHPRWADVVVHRGIATWVEVADDPSQDARGQIARVLTQIDETLLAIGSQRSRLLSITIYLADINQAGVLNELWDAWVPRGHAPVRACVQAGLSGTLAVEMVVVAAVP